MTLHPVPTLLHCPDRDTFLQIKRRLGYGGKRRDLTEANGIPRPPGSYDRVGCAWGGGGECAPFLAPSGRHPGAPGRAPPRRTAPQFVRLSVACNVRHV